MKEVVSFTSTVILTIVCCAPASAATITLSGTSWSFYEGDPPGPTDPFPSGVTCESSLSVDAAAGGALSIPCVRSVLDASYTSTIGAQGVFDTSVGLTLGAIRISP